MRPAHDETAHRPGWWPTRTAAGAAQSVAVLVPCRNEGLTIAAVVRSFRDALPHAVIYVYDNNSDDDTSERARQAGAVVRRETQPGKGNVVRRMFSDIEADVYVLVDGDGTYDARLAPRMVELLLGEGLAMVVGRRIYSAADLERRGHRLGNRLFSTAVEWIFGKTFRDILSGYRVFSRRFVKSFPVFARGFEVETELTVHALTLRLPAVELDTQYGVRIAGSTSKLSTGRDGLRILLLILTLFRSERPLLFYSILGCASFLLSAVLTYPLIVTFLETGLVPRFPTAILSTGLAVSGFISLACGLILDAVTRGRREARMLAYLSLGAVPFARGREPDSPVGSLDDRSGPT